MNKVSTAINETVSKLVRSFRKRNGRIMDDTRTRKYITYRANPAKETVTSTRTAIDDSVKPVTVQAEAQTKPVKSNPRRTKELMDRADRVFANQKKVLADKAKADAPRQPDNAPSPVYYVKNGRYYLTYRDKKVWVFSMQGTQWNWLNQHKEDGNGSHILANRDDFERILNEKYSMSGLRLAYNIHAVTEWDFNGRAEKDTYKRMKQLVDFESAVKV